MSTKEKVRGRYFVEPPDLPAKDEEIKKGTTDKKGEENPGNVHPLDSVSDQDLFYLVDIGNTAM